jgi:hypothetical protein
VFKVGHSSNVIERLRGIQTVNPFAELMLAWEGAQEEEKYLLRLLDDFVLHHEVVSTSLDALRAAAEMGGYPVVWDHAQRKVA